MFIRLFVRIIIFFKFIAVIVNKFGLTMRFMQFQVAINFQLLFEYVQIVIEIPFVYEIYALAMVQFPQLHADSFHQFVVTFLLQIIKCEVAAFYIAIKFIVQFNHFFRV